jgi:hypothetical protein
LSNSTSVLAAVWRDRQDPASERLPSKQEMVIDEPNREAAAHTEGIEVTVKKEGVYRLSNQSKISDKCKEKDHRFGVDHGNILFIIEHVNHVP